MAYLLFVKPEMLLPGSRRNLFTTAYDELKNILKEGQPTITKRESKRGKPEFEEERYLYYL
jgi:hypothetical protein